ncbi:MAG: hypothetical protein ACE5EN_06000 [Nitrospinota bacterium]
MEKFIKLIKILFITILVAIVLIVAGYITYSSYHKRLVAKAIQSEQLIIDRTNYDWKSQGDISELELTLWIINKSSNDVSATLVFEVTIDYTKIDTEWFDDFIKKFGKKELLKTYSDWELDSIGPRGKALLNYLKKPSKPFPHAPYIDVDWGKDNKVTERIFKFKKHVAINSGGIKYIEHTQSLPDRNGYKVMAKVVGIAK